MNERLNERLDQILPRVVTDDFLSGSGIGNEIAFYIFDYPAEDELQVRAHLDFLIERIPKEKPHLRVNHINLFDFVLEHLQNRKLLDKALQMQREKGDDALLKALAGPLHETKIAKEFAQAARPAEHDLIIVSGVGSIWPLLRAHSLLNNLQPLMGNTPMLMFYPGRYDVQAPNYMLRHQDARSLRLFGKLKSNNYYRAFKLVP